MISAVLAFTLAGFLAGAAAARVRLMPRFQARAHAFWRTL
jgi:hypothetical protein